MTAVNAAKMWVKALIGNIAWLLRPRLPWPLAQKFLERRTAKTLASPRMWAIALEEMTLLLGEVASPEEIADLAARYLEFAVYELELRWHPKRAMDQRVEGVEHVLAARELGRGVVVSFVHHAFYAGMFGAIRRAGIEHATVVRPGALNWYERPRQRQNFLLFRRGGPLINVREGTAGMAKRLATGQVVVVATDVPGSSTVTFAGREVACSSGAIWAARETKSPIVAVDAYRTSDGHVVRFSAPWYPDDFESTQEILETVVAHHEEAILQWPEATLSPTMTWASADS